MTTQYDHFDRNDVFALLLLIGAFLLLSRHFFWFTLDDAYITARYSENFVETGEILWNVGMDPVEGYTSFLWVLVGTIPGLLDISIITFFKATGIVSTLASIVLLYIYGHYRNVNKWVLFVGVAQLALSPAIALLSIQGMETTTAMLFVLIATIGTMEMIRSYRPGWAIVTNVALLLGMLTRPDLVIFAICLEGALAVVYYTNSQISGLKRLIGWGFVLVFVPGIMYTFARIQYFGYPLPNPFYVKTSNNIISLAGSALTFKFVMMLLSPILFISLLYVSTRESPRSRITESLAIFIPGSVYLMLWLFVKPTQGFLWRFQVPAFAALILSILLVFDTPLDKKLRSAMTGQSLTRALLLLVLLSGLVAYPLITFQSASQEAIQRTPGDRVVMGQALEQFAGQDYRMFVTESGALPYYSGWTAVDELGLNSERITHKGLSREFLSDYDPDVIQLLVFGEPGMIQQQSAVTASYLEAKQYRLVAVTYKQSRDRTVRLGDTYHLYFVDTRSEGYRKISCALLTQDLAYAEASIITSQSEINVQSTDLTAEKCR